MNQYQVKLGYSQNQRGVHTNEVSLLDTRLGCKGSSVQIRPRRPIYLPEIIEQSKVNLPQRGQCNSAHIRSKTQAIEGIVDGKSGVNPDVDPGRILRISPTGDPRPALILAFRKLSSIKISISNHSSLKVRGVHHGAQAYFQKSSL